MHTDIPSIFRSAEKHISKHKIVLCFRIYINENVVDSNHLILNKLQIISSLKTKKGLCSNLLVALKNLKWTIEFMKKYSLLFKILSYIL